MCKHNYAKIHPKDNCIVCFYDYLKGMSKDEMMAYWKGANDKK